LADAFDAVNAHGKGYSNHERFISGGFMMKKLIGILAVVALAVAAAVLGAGDDWIKSSYDPAAASGQKGVSVSTEFASYPKDAKTIKLLIRNDSDGEHYYGYPYTIEMKKSEDWYAVPLKDEAAFIAIAVALPAHSTQEYNVTLENFKKAPAAGQYRVVFNQNYVAEFTLTG
jgi:hypothetical protein